MVPFAAACRAPAATAGQRQSPAGTAGGRRRRSARVRRPSVRQGGVGAAHHDDGVLAGVVDEMTATPLGPVGTRAAGAACRPRRPTRAAPQFRREGVVADGAEEAHLGTGPRRGDGLIGALAARAGRQRRWPRIVSHRRGQPRGGGHQVHVDAAEDGDPGSGHTPRLTRVGGCRLLCGCRGRVAFGAAETLQDAAGLGVRGHGGRRALQRLPGRLRHEPNRDTADDRRDHHVRRRDQVVAGRACRRRDHQRGRAAEEGGREVVADRQGAVADIRWGTARAGPADIR